RSSRAFIVLQVLAAILESLGLHRKDVMSHAIVFMWPKRFQDGRKDLEDDERSGRPSTSKTDENLAKVRHVSNRDQRLSIRMIAEERLLVEGLPERSSSSRSLRPSWNLLGHMKT